MSIQENTDESFSMAEAQMFFERSNAGFVIADGSGRIKKANHLITGWIGTAEITGIFFSDLLSIGSKIYYETHLSPLLRMQGFFDEILVEINSSSGIKLKVLVNAAEYRDTNGAPQSIYYTITKATDRIQYEENLKFSKTLLEKQLKAEKDNVLLREQLIAVLAHDLRNPLSSMIMAAELLEKTKDVGLQEELLPTFKRSGYRMRELINNITDFARTRMGGGIIINLKDADLEGVLQQIIDEARLVHPGRKIVTEIALPELLSCDPDRFGQLFANLLSNALSYGTRDLPVVVQANYRDNTLQVSVCNSCAKLSDQLLQHLFDPFTRENKQENQTGLGLGLYIAHQIAHAHNASLTCTSSDQETCFTLTMRCQ